MTSSFSNQSDVKTETHAEKIDKRILLMGNPNVGKSVFFSHLTGMHVVSSNFSGTTVSYTEGAFELGGKSYTLIDVPGTYSTRPTSDAEAVASAFLQRGAAVVICVLDASNLTRSLKLALEVKQYGWPVIYTLNLMDVARRHGTNINVRLLEQELQAPVVPTVAVKGEGLPEIIKHLETITACEEILQTHESSDGHTLPDNTNKFRKKKQVKTVPETCRQCPSQCFGYQTDKTMSDQDLWDEATLITQKVRSQIDGERGLLDKLGEKMLRPWPGVPIAIFVILVSLGVIVGGGKALRSIILLPLVNQIIVPLFRNGIAAITPEGIFQNILIGEYGIFVISFEWIIALILPYVFLFYLLFSFLEDSGYLPRVSVLFDGLMRKIGIQGGSLITLSMGFGCAVPAIIGSRSATTYKERLIVSTMVCFAVPCISQTGALISLLGSHSIWLLMLMVLLAMLILVAVSLVLGKVLKGKIDPLILEVPNLLIPERKAYGKKLMIRMKHFLMEAEVPMLISVVIAAVLKESGLLDFLAVQLEPLVSGWLGMPREAVIALILGVVRREMAAAPLLALDLTGLQIFVGATVALLYLPCISVFGVLTKEFKTKVAVLISLSTVLTALLIGGLINQAGQLLLR